MKGRRRRLRMVAMMYLTSTCHTHPFYSLFKAFVASQPAAPATAPMAAFLATFFATCLAAALVILAAIFFAARLATVLATFPAAFAAMRPANFDASHENIPEPRCPLLGKIPRRLGSVALISVFICRGVSLPPICFSPVSLRSELSARSCTSSAHAKPAPNCGKGRRPLRGVTRGRRHRTRVVIVFCQAHMEVRLFIYAFILLPFCLRA